MQAFSRIGVGMSGVASLVLLAAGGAPAVAGNPVNTGPLRRRRNHGL